MASAAIAGVRSCCEMLSEGKAEIQRIKKGVTDAKEIVKEAKGFIGFISGLFSRHDPIAAAVESTTKTVAKVEYIDHVPTEEEVKDQFFDHMTNFMEAQSVILDYILDEKDKILNTFNAKQNTKREAANLMKYERKINDMALEFSELMAAAPRRLGNIRDQFQEKYTLVIEAQAKAKERERIKRANEQWQREQAFHDKVDLSVGLFVTMLFVIELWAVWINLFTEAW